MSATGASPFYPDDVAMPTHEAGAGIIAITEAGQDVFRADAGTGNHLGGMFGGRLLAQALAAALRGVAAMPVTSFHAMFLAPGRIGHPVEYRVVRLRDSRRFANRQVTAWQGGQAIFTLMAAFHAIEDGFAHQTALMPDVPPPEAVMPIQDYVRLNGARIDDSAFRNFSGAIPVELRPVAPDSYFVARAHCPRSFWFRLPGAADITDPRLHQCLIAYGSDYWLAGVAAIPHVFPTNGRRLMISSLDHAMWFHRPARCDEWLLHHTESPTAGDGLGLAQGKIFNRAGRLIATTTQECLIRRLVPDA